MFVPASLVVAIAIPLAVGLAGSMSTAGAVRSAWYRNLAKPSWQPPSALFAPVWTALYVLMGLASWLVWTRLGARGGALLAYPLVAYAVQLALNGAWTPVFFARESPRAALAIMVLLLAAVLETVRAFGGVDPRAALLMLPYLAWTCFAAALNARIVQLNPPPSS